MVPCEKHLFQTGLACISIHKWLGECNIWYSDHALMWQLTAVQALYTTKSESSFHHYCKYDSKQASTSELLYNVW